jgi:CHAD domain-containing protein
MTTSAHAIQKRWNASMRDRWKRFSRQWSDLRRHSSSNAVHKMRTASRRMASSINVALLSAGVPGERATRRLDQLSDQLGPVRDNHVYRKKLERLKTSGNVRAFIRYLARHKAEEYRRLDKYLRRHPKRRIHQQVDKIERKLQRISKDWTAGDFRTAFEKVLRRRFEILIQTHEEWKNNPDNKRFHRMRVELRELRYASEDIGEVLGLSRTHNIQTVLQIMRSLQTSMGNIHDIHKLRTELVAWSSSRSGKKRALRMTAASELQKELKNRTVEFKDHSLASKVSLPTL